MRRWGNRALAGFTVVGGLIAIAQVSSTVRRSSTHWVRVHPGWTLTIGLVVVLLLLIFALVLKDRGERALRQNDSQLERLRGEMSELADANTATMARVAEQTLERDRDVYRAIRQHMPRSAIRWIAEHDFGSSWDGERVYPFFDIEDRLDPLEHRFASPDLEGLRERLFAAVDNFGQTLAIESGPAKGRDRIYNVMDPEDIYRNPEGERIAKDRAHMLNEAADRVLAAYDELVKAAQGHGIYD